MKEKQIYLSHFSILNANQDGIQKIKSQLYSLTDREIFGLALIAYSGGYPFSISGDIRSVPS